MADEKYPDQPTSGPRGLAVRREQGHSDAPRTTSLVSAIKDGLARLMPRKDSKWFGPHQPQAAQAPEAVAGRQLDYPTGYNLNQQPRANEPITFAALRELADACDILRAVIETRKDQVARMAWTIKPKDKKAKPDQACKDAIAFFQSPDRVHTWDGWVRMLIEDMLVIDAATLYPRKTNGGQLYALEPIDGSTIKIVIDDAGRRPVPPQPAFTQVLKGCTAVHYTADELCYHVRNVRTHKVYGFSHVEQIVLTIQIAIRRALSQHDYFTAGTQPDAIAGMPETWTGPQIALFQQYFDNMMQGDQSKRRAIRFLPKAAADGYKETKSPPLKDQFDEWIARVVCYVFSLEVTPFVAQVNRAVAESNAKQAQADGLVPIQRWVKSIVDDALWRQMGLTDLEFSWEEEEAVDPKTQADIDGIYIDKGVVTIDEVRDRLGMEARAKPATPDAAEPQLGPDGKPLPAPEPQLDAEGKPIVQEPQLGPDGKPLPVDPNAPIPVGAKPAAGADVQSTALNGTQISSLMAMVQSAADKALPIESIEAMIAAAFPMLREDQIKAMTTPLLNFEPVKPAIPEALGGPPAVDEDGKPIEQEESEEGAAPAGKPVPPKPGAKKPVVVPTAKGDIILNITVEAPIVDITQVKEG